MVWHMPSSVGWRRMIVNEVQSCVNPMLSHGGFSAYQMALGPSPAGLFLRRDDDGDLEFERDMSTSGQVTQQRKLRAMAQESALAEIRRLATHE